MARPGTHLRRPGPALLVGALVAVLGAGCTGSATAPGHVRARLPAQPGTIPVQPAAPAAAPSTPAGESRLACGSFIDARATTASLRTVLGVVALPASPGYPALQTSVSGDGRAGLRLFAKTGLIIRAGAAFELIVAGGFASRVSIGWGAPATPSHRVAVESCSGTGGRWLAYAGGYWLDHPACVPVIVRAGRRQSEVHIGIGTPCPGQQAPQGPSQS